MKHIKGHDDASADKKLFSGMMKKAMPAAKVTSHLKKDVTEQKKGISSDKKLMKSIKPFKKKLG